MKIPIEDLERTIASIPEISRHVACCALRQKEMNCSFLLELKEDSKVSYSDQNIWRQQIIDRLREFNEDFRAAHNAFRGEDEPGLELFPFRKSPMSEVASHKKRQCVFFS